MSSEWPAHLKGAVKMSGRAAKNLSSPVFIDCQLFGSASRKMRSPDPQSCTKRRTELNSPVCRYERTQPDASSITSLIVRPGAMSYEDSTMYVGGGDPCCAMPSL